MTDFSHHQERLIVRFWNLLITALDLPDVRLDLSKEMPACIVDLSHVLGDLVPAHPTKVFASRVPVVLTTAGRLLDTRFSDRLIHTVHTLGGEDSALVFVLPFIEKDDLETRRTSLRSELRTAGQHVVLFGREDLGRILADPAPQRALRGFVLSQIDIAYVSPYATAGRTSDPVFFGRESEMREISDHIIQDSYAVVGGRRIGKTSMLRRLSNHILPQLDFQTVYLDCSSISSHPSLMHTRLREWNPPKPGLTLETFGNILQLPPTDLPLVILLDEVDKLLDYDREAEPRGSWPLSNQFRSFSNNGYGTFVFAGERILREVLRDSTSPFFNFVRVLRLKPLGIHAVGELVVKPMKKLEIVFSDEDAIIRRIWDVTSGHPAVVQRLCDRLVAQLAQHALRRLTPADVDQIITDPVFIHDDFLATYLSQATVLEHLLVLLMAKDASLCTGEDLHHALERDGITVTLSQVIAAAERLTDLRNILRRTDEGYSVAVPAIQVVIPNHKRLSELVRLRREIYLHVGDIPPEYAPIDLRADLW